MAQAQEQIILYIMCKPGPCQDYWHHVDRVLARVPGAKDAWRAHVAACQQCREWEKEMRG